MDLWFNELIWGYQSSQTPDLRRESSVGVGGRRTSDFGDQTEGGVLVFLCTKSVG